MRSCWVSCCNNSRNSNSCSSSNNSSSWRTNKMTLPQNCNRQRFNKSSSMNHRRKIHWPIRPCWVNSCKNSSSSSNSSRSLNKKTRRKNWWMNSDHPWKESFVTSWNPSLENLTRRKSWRRRNPKKKTKHTMKKKRTRTRTTNHRHPKRKQPSTPPCSKNNKNINDSNGASNKNNDNFASIPSVCITARTPCPPRPSSTFGRCWIRFWGRGML
mmetsp:Transcript_42586/g.89375  ORF Transcript_42586/g.89375 Transcript_42586/m.89375 type:complete len:213 (+) Transcript_42586:1319-1957(+)